MSKKGQKLTPKQKVDKAAAAKKYWASPAGKKRKEEYRKEALARARKLKSPFGGEAPATSVAKKELDLITSGGAAPSSLVEAPKTVASVTVQVGGGVYGDSLTASEAAELLTFLVNLRARG